GFCRPPAPRGIISGGALLDGMSAEQISEGKVFARLTPLVAQAGLTSGQQAAAGSDELPNAGGLLICHGRKARKNQKLQSVSRRIAFDVISMHWKIRDSRA